MIPAPTCDLCGRADAEIVPVAYSIARQPVFSARLCKPHADDLRAVVEIGFTQRLTATHKPHVRRV